MLDTPTIPLNSVKIPVSYTHLMKTTVLFRMIVLVAMVFAGISNATVKAQNNNFITNEETVGDLVVSKVIYRLDGSLYRHMNCLLYTSRCV